MCMILAVIHAAAYTADAAPVIAAIVFIHFDHLANIISMGKAKIHVTFCHW